MAILLIPAIACGGGEESTPTPTPAETPTPTPTPIPTLPNLTITNVTFDPATGCAGAPVQVTITFQNQGTLLSSPCHWTWVLYQGKELSGTLISLPPGAITLIQTEITLDNNIIIRTNTTATVDSVSEVAELNESDNQFIKPFTVEMCEASYNSDKSKIQTALTAYMASHNSSIPLTNKSVQLNYPFGIYNIIDVCLLQGVGDLLDGVPTSCIDSSFDNCNAVTCTCNQNAHYIWLADGAGSVMSVCIGSDCRRDSVADGYQDIYP